MSIVANRDIYLTSGFKTGCDAHAKVIVKADREVGADVKIQTVKITDIKKNDRHDSRLKRNSYSGILEVTYYKEPLVHPLRPIRVPLQLTTNDSGDLLECTGNTNYAVDMQDGWTLIDENIRNEDGLIKCLEDKAKQNRDRLFHLGRRYNNWHNTHSKSCLSPGDSYRPYPRWTGVPIGNCLTDFQKTDTPEGVILSSRCW